MDAKKYYRVMLGKGGTYFEECFAGNFIGADYEIRQDLTTHLPDDWRTFNKEFIPIFLVARPDKTRIAAGLACGSLWTIAKGIHQGDIVLSPDGTGHYHVAEVTGKYYYFQNGILPHRRPVLWLKRTIERAAMSEALRNSCGAAGGVSNISQYAEEIENLLGGVAKPVLVSTDETVQDPLAFALEDHLEKFLVKNWIHTDLGKEYDIFTEEGEIVGQQYATDTGPIDILAISKDKKRLLVVELKKGRASDVVMGQTLRYMGYVHDELAEEGQTVEGVIIAHEDDQKIRRALVMVPSISFLRYQVYFKLIKD